MIRSQLVMLVTAVAALLPRAGAPGPVAVTDLRVDIGGYRLRAQIRGEGSPTVVLETGMGEPLETWQSLPDRLAETTTVVAYDRAGLGDSDLGPEPRDAGAVAHDLHVLLEELDLPPPYVLVGHSLGGLYVRVYTEAWPEEVVGLVLIDPTTEGMLESLKTEEGRAEVMRQLEAESEGVKAEARATPGSME